MEEAGVVDVKRDHNDLNLVIPCQFEIRGHLGTHSAAIYFVHNFDEAPSVGDRISMRSDQDDRVTKWTSARVSAICGDVFYFELVNEPPPVRLQSTPASTVARRTK